MPETVRAFDTNLRQVRTLREQLRRLIFWLNVGLATAVLIQLNFLIRFWNWLFDRANLIHGSHWLAGYWARVIMHSAPGWRWSYQGFEHLPKPGDKPVVMVANHQSAADIGAIYLTKARFRWLSKDSMFRVPIIGLCMRWAGYVPLKRGDRASGNQAMNKSAAWIRSGVSMFFFPEGTRSEDGQLKSFKTGAFRLALEEGVDILPVILCGTKDMMLKNSSIPKPAHIILEVMPRVASLPGEDAEAFALRVEQLIRARLSILEKKR